MASQFSFSAACLSLCVLTLAQPVSAADAEGRFSLDGVGNRSCADFTAAFKEGDRLAAAFASWVNGFISATNVFQPNTFDITPFQTNELTLAKLNKFCLQNPEEPFAKALGALVAVYNETRLSSSSPLVRVDRNGRGVFVYKAQLDRVADKLVSVGALIAAPKTDQETSDGLLEYQRMFNLPPTGLPDLQTLNHMFP